MAFVKQHLVLILAGLIAVVSIGLGVFGFLRMDRISGRMDASVQLFNQLRGSMPSSGKAVNPQAIDAASAAVDQAKQNYESIRDSAIKINERQPLLDRIFPEVERKALSYSFREAYRDAIDALPKRMGGGGKPSSVDVDNWRMGLQEQARLGDASLNTEDPVSMDPAARAAIHQARKIRCYADKESFDVRELYDLQKEPTAQQMWDAQMSLWIQQDVVDVIAAMNEAAASGLPADQKANVLTLPVKRIVGIKVGDYVGAASSPTASPARRESAGTRSAAAEAVDDPPDEPSDVFTRRKPNALYDIVYFRVGVIIDSRYVQQFIAKMSEKNLYSPIEVSLEDVEASPEFHDYLYGPGRVVRLDVAFEASLLRTAFKELMPDAVRKRIDGRGGRT